MSAHPAAREGLSRDDVLFWLRETDAARLDELWRAADETRAPLGRRRRPPARPDRDLQLLRARLHLLRHPRRQSRPASATGCRRGDPRRRAHKARAFGYGTLVMQAGEDYGHRGRLAGRRRPHASRPRPSLAITLSLGERSEDELRALARGRRRPLPAALRDLRRGALPPHPPRPRRPGRATGSADLRTLRQLGYEAGTGVMVGIPGQTHETVADDIELFRGLDMDMIGIGPYLPHPATPLGAGVRTPHRGRRLDRRPGRPTTSSRPARSSR